MRAMARWLVAWEAGGYLGHEMLVTAAALQLRAAGHEVQVCAPRRVPPNRAALQAGIGWIPMPDEAAPPAPATGVRWKSRATSLWGFGFHSVDWVRERIAVWSDVLARKAPDGVVLQAAPYAQLAARAAGVPSLEFGIGFDVPPRLSPFPPMRQAEAFTPEAGRAFEQRLLDALPPAGPREAATREGATLAARVSGDRRLVVSLPELDHYAGIAEPSRVFIGPLPPVDLGGETVLWARGEQRALEEHAARGPRLLAYVRASAVDVPAILAAVSEVAGEAIVVCPGASDDHAALAERLGVRFHRSPVPLAGVLPGADLVVCHGGGLMGEALVLGRPCVAMPIHHEQLMAASAMVRHRLGVMLDPRASALFVPAWRHVLGDAVVRANVAALALRRGELASRSGATFVAAAQALLQGDA
jgi:UDP:flavonoid glycosyltransferase YjiC (YdhE family)